MASTRAALKIDPLQTTFRGGRHEPLHGWFPYLEGYSPDFVAQILRTFAPDAKAVFDPFGGSGTTPLTAARLGLRSFYSELNPVLRVVVAAKALALALPPEERAAVAARLMAEADRLEEALAASPPAADLVAAHQETFGRSRFFSPAAFDRVLRARALVDRLQAEASPSAPFVEIAFLGSLVPASLLIRRGDLRFKKGPELEREQPELAAQAAARLQAMARDLERLPPEPLVEAPRCVAHDARALDAAEPFVADAVVTSPPYLNGTNYFRNTKIELWWLRHLRRAADLTAFRARAVTAGINDVARGRQATTGIRELDEVVSRVAAQAYDRRIPTMVASYFHDMREVFSGMRRHLTPGALVAVDLGDSIYNGVHVPTHAMLATLLEREGYLMEEEVLLRRRTSRGGQAVSQVLLVLRRGGGAT